MILLVDSATKCNYRFARTLRLNHQRIKEVINGRQVWQIWRYEAQEQDAPESHRQRGALQNPPDQRKEFESFQKTAANPRRINDISGNIQKLCNSAFAKPALKHIPAGCPFNSTSLNLKSLRRPHLLFCDK